LISNTTASNSVAIGGNSGNLSTGGNGLFLGMYAGAYMTTEANLLILNSLNRSNKANDTTLSPIYAVQNATGTSQRMKLGGGGTVGINQYGNSTLAVNGSFSTSIIAKTTTYTATIDDNTITSDATGGAFTITLPTAVGCSGREYLIKKTDSGGNAVTVGTTSSQTIDGSTTYALNTQYKYVRVKSDNANWWIVGNN